MQSHHRTSIQPIKIVNEPLPPPAGLPRATLLLFAFACGISVANIYYAQPLLDAMAESFSLPPASIGAVVTLTQIGYAAGLLFIVPLGDLIDRRRLVIVQTLLSAAVLAVVGTASRPVILLAGMALVGLLAVVVQVLVAFTATLATPAARGRSVGFVTSGLVTGILGARFFAGALADLGGWRTVYLVSAGLMGCTALLLARTLPRHLPLPPSESYGSALRSVPRLFLQEPVLRVRAVLAFFIFASFSTFWTAMVLPLSAAPLALSHTRIGMFGLAGLAGALAASGAGRLADRGWSQRTTGIALTVLTCAWWPISLLPKSLVALTAGVILLDLAVQAVHVTNQSLIFAIRPEARSRLVGGYMAFYSAGSAVGAIAATTLYAAAGWTAVSLLGASFSTAGLLFWAATRPEKPRRN